MELTAHQICKTWTDGRVAVRDFTARFTPGSITALVGRNGSGKTTLMRLLVGLLNADSGSVKRPDGRLGFLFQQSALWPHLNVRKQLELALRLVVGHDQPTKQADVLMEKFGIAKFAERFPSELSGGQQQRVAIARCLCVDPVAVFLDEITNSLDPESQHEMALLVDDMKQRGLIVISSTHDLAWASRRADHMIYLQDGVAIGQGTPRQVRCGRPNDPFFAGEGTWR